MNDARDVCYPANADVFLAVVFLRPPEISLRLQARCMLSFVFCSIVPKIKKNKKILSFFKIISRLLFGVIKRKRCTKTSNIFAIFSACLLIYLYLVVHW